MPEFASVYVRVPSDLKEQIDSYAASTSSGQVSSAVAELIRRGLRFEEVECRMGELMTENNDARYRLDRCRSLLREMYKQSEELLRWFGAYRLATERDPDRAREYLLALAAAVGIFLADKPDMLVMREVAGLESAL